LIGLGSGMLRNVNWYQLKPDRWVFNDLNSTNSATASKAMRELLRRQQSVGLSSSVEQDLIELALKEQGSSMTAPLRSDLVNLLGTAYTKQKLTAAQRERFLSQCVQLTLKVRPRIPVGGSSNAQLSYAAGTPSPGFWLDIEHDEVAFGEKKQSAGGSSKMSGVGSMGSSVPIKPTKLGPQEVKWTTHVKLYHGPWDNTATLLWESKPVLTASFEAVATPDADPMRRITTPDAATIRQCVGNVKITRGANNLQMNIELKNAPANLAFEAFLRIDGKEHSVSTMTLAKGGSTTYGLQTNAVAPAASRADLILRSSERVARQTIDFQDYWDGEIIIPNISITPKPLPATAPTSRSN
jgi:hypothetical protein